MSLLLKCILHVLIIFYLYLLWLSNNYQSIFQIIYHLEQIENIGPETHTTPLVYTCIIAE